MKRSYLFIIVCAVVTALYADQQVVDTKVYQREGTLLRILGGSVDLPSAGIWVTEQDSSDVYLVPPDEAGDQLTGRRMGEVQLQEQINGAQRVLSQLSWQCGNYAHEHDNTGPASIDDMDTNTCSYLIANFKQVPWDEVPGHVDSSGPYYYLVPHVPFEFKDQNRYARATNHVVLAFELRPYIADGKHWVCYTDGTCRREEINQERVAEQEQEIRPVFKERPQFGNLPATFTYSILATKPEESEMGTETVSLKNIYTGERMAVAWDLQTAKPGDQKLLEQLREYQLNEWWCYLQVSDSPALQTWTALVDNDNSGMQGNRRRGENTSMFGVMGGYAAVRETLQMQLIGSTSKVEERTVPIGSVTGVEVKSHPYDEMLGDRQGGSLALANLAPKDHLFVYLAKPESMLPMLGSGADFASELGNAITGNSIKYYLKARYLKRLGMEERWLERLLKCGGVKECALFAPDMFFLDGTDITVVTRMSNARLIIPLLKVLGIPTLSDQKIAEFENKDGYKTYWTIRDDLLLLSTSKAELQLVLDLHAKGGKGSLGESAEFRYMLTRLPASDMTRCYAYCSDPFIRRLVGPATKIGQLRRVEAMNQLQLLSSGALLAMQDGFGKVQSVEILKQHGYLPATFEAGNEYSIDANLVAHSKTYGTLANLAPIGSVPVEMVTKYEAETYGNYVRNYSRFWRQFFDPIAFRLDDASDGSLEASVYILPLIDSSIYGGLRQFVMTQEDGLPMKTPVFSPDPVLRFSINLKEEAWQGIAEGMSEMLTHYVMVDPAILDDLGSSIHLSINDGDPVVALGSGDILGAFGGMTSGMNEEMVMIPLFLSVLTRPSTIAIETSDPEKTTMYLRNAADSVSDRRWWGEDIRSEIYQIEGRDSWVCLFDILGMVQLRYGLEVKDGFLLIRNIPWSSKDQIEKVETAELNGMGLKVWPSACNLQLPGLFSTAAEKERMATLQGMGFLYPLVSSGYASLETAFDKYMNLFGFTPAQASGDQWTWTNATIESARYGSVFQKRQPSYIGDNNFGLMDAIQDLALQMQFEETGLRATIKWKTRPE